MKHTHFQRYVGRWPNFETVFFLRFWAAGEFAILCITDLGASWEVVELRKNIKYSMYICVIFLKGNIYFYRDLETKFMKEAYTMHAFENLKIQLIESNKWFTSKRKTSDNSAHSHSSVHGDFGRMHIYNKETMNSRLVPHKSFRLLLLWNMYYINTFILCYTGNIYHILYMKSQKNLPPNHDYEPFSWVIFW